GEDPGRPEDPAGGRGGRGLPVASRRADGSVRGRGRTGAPGVEGARARRRPREREDARTVPLAPRGRAGSRGQAPSQGTRAGPSEGGPPESLDPEKIGGLPESNPAR